MGDPAGIGGEITALAWRKLKASAPQFVVVADPEWLASYALVQVISDVGEARFGDAIPVLPVRLREKPVPGAPSVENAGAVVDSVERAVRLAQAGAVGGVVTNPIAKSVLQSAGFPYPGHTEFLAELTGAAGREIMMLASPMLRVVPVTVHVSLRRALDGLTKQAIIAAARTTQLALIRDFGIASPRLAVAGLNPHAGEQGRMGTEEDTLIAPAIAVLRAEGLDVSGPWPPDTMFTESARARYDAAICMYHDQALIPLKTLDMAGGVNVTLGLPIVRTSPDHGTAFDIAGKGVADESSLIAALRLADAIAARRGRAL
jgi:4-hydroxythreonine-4-phosphate dehydrogenase